ncbi:fungal hydrophobin [Fistulina hepatica ATCC 64428]|uniref:Hydrophobin n=1 Tax=Fistulina hepatica ATCC 64428 TaxID=1128425 RepID=A0A0D7A481_9AGAR|nr:fungal hydrophobin [Fistulina hepatica ATCC 64428]
MFARISSLFLFVVALLAVTAAAGGGGATTTVTVTAPGSTATSIPASDCSVSNTQCCDTVTTTSDPAASLLLGLLGIVVDLVDVIVGLGCSPISVLSGGDDGCSGEVVCCENDNFSGLIAIGCTPINIDL